MRYAIILLGIFLAVFSVTFNQSIAEESKTLSSASKENLGAVPKSSKPTPKTKKLWKEVTIHRDNFGVPHIIGESDQSVIFGFAYAQAEDSFWNIEDNYILALGRYSEFHGPQGLNSDLLNRSFEIVSSSKKDFKNLDAKAKEICTAFVDGLNYFLKTHPQVRPRCIKHFEPWQVLAYYRQIHLELCYRYTHLSDSFIPRHNRRSWTQIGSNGWAIGPRRTKNGTTILMVNPHLPYYGFAQLYEAHISGTESRDGERWNFTGATFLGAPLLLIGHNEFLGWTLTTNEPDVADAWRLKFTDKENPLAYEYDGGYKQATEWKEVVNVRIGQQISKQVHTFRKTHLGPVVEKVDETTYYTAKISGLYDIIPARQSMPMMKARNFKEFKNALALLQLPYMNILYADRDGNIFYVYGARAPRKDPQFDWTKPVEGKNPKTAWQGVHGFKDLPKLLNPKSGFIQNCNSSPYITTIGQNPLPSDSPPYLVEDADQHKRRALRSLQMLRKMDGVTLEDVEKAAFDTEVYWAKHEMQTFLNDFDIVKKKDSELAEAVQPLIEHLKAWNGRITADSGAATLCEGWFEELYETEYPSESLKKEYVNNPFKRMEALDDAASKLERLFGKWNVPYGKVHRLQRRSKISDLFELRFNDRGHSLQNLGGFGPMGVIFTQYYTPSIHIPLIISQKKRYGVLGATYLAVYEFGPDGVRGKSIVPYGANASPKSDHYFDQAELFSASQMKSIPFTQKEVKAAAVQSYHPGERPKLSVKRGKSRSLRKSHQKIQ